MPEQITKYLQGEKIWKHANPALNWGKRAQLKGKCKFYNAYFNSTMIQRLKYSCQCGEKETIKF